MSRTSSPANKSLRGGSRGPETGVRGIPSPFINLDERGRDTPHPSLLPLVPARKDFLDGELGRVGIEAGVGGMTSAAVGHHVERAAGGEVGERRYRQTHEHRDVGTAERLRHGSLEVLGAEEWNHGDEADAVSPQAAPIPASVHAARIEYLTHRVMPPSNQIEVHEVDRGPR